MIMPLSQKDIDHIANLARLGLSDKEKTKYSKELSEIFDYVEKLNEVNTKSVEPTSQAAGLTNVLRKDENPHEANADKIKKMIGQASEREDNFVKTKAILEK